ncbi:MAG: FtsX-like permease family protein [Anaerolineaceae bacterium]|nr:FtsX-like permease family protein [Anaerolineaceae bacterium]
MNIQWILALRYLNGRKLRTFLTTLAVVFGVLVIFGMNIMLPTLLKTFQATMLAASNEVDLTVSHRAGTPFNNSVLDEVRAVEGVRVAQGLVSRPLNLPADFFDQDPTQQDRISVLTMVGLDPALASQMRAYLMDQGRFLQEGDTGVCLISVTMADTLGLQLGDTLQLPTAQGLTNLEIVGILPPRMAPGNEEVLVPVSDAQYLLEMEGKFSSVEANFNTTAEDERAAIEQAVSSRLGSEYQLGALSSASEIFGTLQIAQNAFNVIGALALFMGAFIIFNTFRTLIAERRRDIGMLRAVGASRRMITGIILTEGLIQGIVGTLTGMVLGYLLVELLMGIATPLLGNFMNVQLQKPVVTLSIVLISSALGIGVTLLAGLLPAFSAGRVTPLEALRPSTNGKLARRMFGASAITGIILIALSLAALFSGQPALATPGALIFIAGLILIAPALVRPIALGFGALFSRLLAREGTGFVAQGNLTRQPERVAVTASTSMIALAIIVVVAGMATTIEETFMRVLRESLGSDYLFIPPSVGIWANNIGADASFADELRAIDGVGAVTSMRFSSAVADVLPQFTKGQSASTDGVAVSMMGIDPHSFPEVGGLEFTQGDPEVAYAALNDERTLIGNGVFMSSTGLKVGDTVPLITPNGTVNYRVVAAAGDFLNIKLITAYISHANMEKDFGKTEDVFLQLNLAPGADQPTVETAIKQVRQNYPQFNMINGKAYYEQMSGLMRMAFSSMYFVFLFLAIPSLIAMINTLAIGVIERTREIGMIRAVGATQKQIRKIVLVEALLLAAVGVAFGLLGGLYLGYVTTNSLGTVGFPVEYYFPWSGLLAAIAVGLIFGALASIIPARQAARLDIIEALRYE